MFNQKDALNSVINLIATRIGYLEDQGNSMYQIGFFATDFVMCGVNKETFCDILQNLKRQGRIVQIKEMDVLGFHFLNEPPEALDSRLHGSVYVIWIDKKSRKYYQRAVSNHTERIQITIDFRTNCIYRIEKGKRLDYVMRQNIIIMVDALSKELGKGTIIGKVLKAKCKYKDVSGVSGAAKRLNEKFITNLHVKYELIKNDRSGYYLNAAEYEIILSNLDY